MQLGHIHKEDRTVLFVIGAIASALTVGLMITGVWQLLYHEPNTALSGYVVGLGQTPSTAESSGVAAIHALFGDMAGILTLFGGAWFMVQVIHRFSWFSAITLLVLVSALITGGVMRFSASVQDGAIDVTTRGYVQFFSGDAELAITDRAELSRLWIIIWTIVHVISLPFLMVSAWFTMHQAQRRHVEKKSSGPTWLQGLESRR